MKIECIIIHSQMSFAEENQRGKSEVCEVRVVKDAEMWVKL